MKSILASIFILFSIVFSSVVQAEPSNPSAVIYKIQTNYNKELITTLSQELLDNEYIGWNKNGLLKTIFTICFLIALAQALSIKNPSSMMEAIAKLAFYTWLVSALMGGPTYEKLNFLQVDDINYTSSANSLDVDIFNFFAYQADQVADQLFGAAMPSKLGNNTQKSNNLIKNILASREHCIDGEKGLACQRQFFKSDYIVDPKTVTGAGVNEETKKGSGSLLPDWLVDWIWKIMALFKDFQTAIFAGLIWVVDFIRAVLNLFIIVALGMITGISFFLLKFMFPFALIPKYRGKVWQAMKIPLSAALYGFCTSLIVYISSAGYAALNQAAFNTIMKAFSSNDAGSVAANLSVIIPYLAVAQMAGTLLFALLQILAFVKIPELSNNLLNLSIDSIVSFAKDTFQTAIGLTGTIIAGGLAATGGLAGGLMGASKAGGLASMLGGAGGAGGAGGILGKVSSFFGAGISQTSPSSLMKNGPSSNLSPSGSKISTGSSMASNDSISDTKIQTISQQAANSESILGRKVKDPDKTLQKKSTSNYSESAKTPKSFNNTEGPDYKGMVSGFISDAMNAGAGNTSALKSRIQNAVTGKSSIVDGIKAPLKMISDPYQQKYNENFDKITSEKNENFDKITSEKEAVLKQQQEATANAEIENKNSQLDYSSERYQSLSNSMEGLSKNDSMFSTQDYSKAKSMVESSQESENLNNKQFSEMNSLFSKKGFGANKEQAELKEQMRQKLSEDFEKSLAKIKKKTAEEEDFEKVYKAYETGDFLRKEDRSRVDSLNDDRYNQYKTGQTDTNSILAQKIKDSGISSKEGSSAFNDLSNRVNEGFVKKDQFLRENSEAIDEIEKTMSQREKEKFEDKINGANQMVGKQREDEMNKISELYKKNEMRLFKKNEENKALLAKYRQLMGEESEDSSNEQSMSTPVDETFKKEQSDQGEGNNSFVDGLESKLNKLKNKSERLKKEGRVNSRQFFSAQKQIKDLESIIEEEKNRKE